MQKILNGDAVEELAKLDGGIAQACVTSPPYWGLRDYGSASQIGAEASLGEYIARLVSVFEEVRRVLADDGCLWLNLGDSYAGGGGYSPSSPANQKREAGKGWGSLNPAKKERVDAREKPIRASLQRSGLPNKNLVGVPWRVALALQESGWILRSEVIWSKPACMPEKVSDRPSRSHEHLFLLTKHARYYYNPAPIQSGPNGANARTVWSVGLKPYSGAHFATYPPELARRCILTASRPGDAVLDPFAGSGTTGAVALSEGRRALMIEVNAAYCDIIRRRLAAAMTGVSEKEQGQGQAALFS